MSEDSLGRGLYLDENLDLSTNTTGDIQGTVDGSKELQKDLAFQLILVTRELIGRPATSQVVALLKDRAIDVAQSDNRVSSVDRRSVDVEKTGRESYRVTMSVVAENEDQELVFNL